MSFNNKYFSSAILFIFVFVSIVAYYPALTPRASAQAVGTTTLTSPANNPYQGSVTTGFTFQNDLLSGQTNADVKELQKFLNASTDTAVSPTGIGSKGQESNYFGPATKAAVIKFQEKYRSEILTPNSLSAGTGKVGPATRTKLNSLIPGGSTASGSQICQFVNLLIVSNVITPEKATLALQAVNCIPNNQTQPQTQTSASVVDLKVNGQDGPVSVSPGATITLSWTSANVTSCSAGNNTKSLSGSQDVVVNTSANYGIDCKTASGGTVSDSVGVNVVLSAAQIQASSTVHILDSYTQVSGTDVTITATTDVLANMQVIYRTNATDSKVATGTATTTAHSVTIKNLKPNTTYYVQLAIIDTNGRGILTDEQTFQTDTPLAENGGLTQKVLYTSDGMGIVSVKESDSLKTKSKVTIEAWVKPSAWRTTPGLAGTNDSVIISKGNIGGNMDYALSLDAGKLVYSNNNAAAWSCSPVVSLNKWTNVAVVIDESTRILNMYVDGKIVPTLCGGTRGVFNKAASIDKSNSISEYVSTSTSGGSNSWLSGNTSSNNTNTGSWGSSSNTSSGWGASASTGNTSSNTGTSLGGTVSNTSNIYIGNYYPKACDVDATKTNGFLGSLDDVKIWNTARTATQIVSDMSSSTATSTTASFTVAGQSASALVAEWSFDDGLATDMTGNGNNGAIKGTSEIIEDATAKSAVKGSLTGVAGSDVNFPESCDAGYMPKETDSTTDQYEVTFKGSVKSVQSCGQYKEAIIQPCDNPPADVVSAVNRPASYMYTSTASTNSSSKTPADFNPGSIAVKFWPGLGMKVPVVGNTGSGTSLMAASGESTCSSNSGGQQVTAAGKATKWNIETISCMKPKKKNQWQTIAVVVVVAVVFVVGCPICAAAVAALGGGGLALAAVWLAVAGVGSAIGSGMEKAGW
ncbi:MAG: LamG-like jellyroll fold domain-containing protein [bacterium]